MTVHFVVRQVSSGPAGNIKYLMPRPPTTRDSQGSDGSIWDRSSSPWRADWEEKNLGRGSEREGGREGAIFETRDRCVHSMSIRPAANNF